MSFKDTYDNYFASLSSHIRSINILNKGITYLPDLSRFKKLKILSCHNNKLTCLPKLPENLEELYCSNNCLISLPELPKNLTILHCYNNQLTYLPELPENLKELECFDNQLTCLPELPENLEELYCFSNELHRPKRKMRQNFSKK